MDRGHNHGLPSLFRNFACVVLTWLILSGSSQAIVIVSGFGPNATRLYVHRWVKIKFVNTTTANWYYKYNGTLYQRAAVPQSTYDIGLILGTGSWTGLDQQHPVQPVNLNVNPVQFTYGPTVGVSQGSFTVDSAGVSFTVNLGDYYQNIDYYLGDFVININAITGEKTVDDPYHPDQDHDGIEDSQDPDDDNDGTLDVNDPDSPLYVPPPPPDNDGDGTDDTLDNDDDNDGIDDAHDEHPFQHDQRTDTDGDGLPNWSDPDDDNDGINDSDDLEPTLPNPPTNPPPGDDSSSDFDGDTTPDYVDPDDDNDGINDQFDQYPKDPTNGGQGGGSGNTGGGGNTQNPGGSGGTDDGHASMNGLGEGSDGLPGNGKPSDSNVANVAEARGKMVTKIQNYKLLAAGTIPKTTVFTRTISLPHFGSMPLTVNFGNQPFPAIRAAIACMLALMLGNSLLKRLTI